MNKQQRINIAMRLVDNAFAVKKNTVRINTHNKIEHEMAKLVKCYEMIKDGLEVYTEVKFKDGGGIADIFIPERMQVVEILCSETEEQLKKKIEKYPSNLDIIAIKTSDILSEIETFTLGN